MVSIKGIKSLVILALSGILINSSYPQVNPIKIGIVGNSISLGIGSTDGLGFRKNLFDKLTIDGVNLDFVGARGAPPFEGHFEDGARIEEFYIGGFGTGENDIAAHMNTFKPEMLLIHLGTNNVRNVLSDVVPYSNDNGISFLNTASGQLAELIQYVMKWKNGTDGSFLKRILVCKIIPKTISNFEDDFNDELENIVSDINNGNVPSIPPGNVILVDQNSPFNTATMLLPDGIHPNDTGYLNMAEVYKNAVIDAINSIDDFNRSNLGSKWTVESEFTIINGELSNTSTDESFGHMAVYDDLTDPSEISIKWGQNANAAGILEGGLALLLDSPSTSADGYLIWHNGSFLTLWSIVNGAPGSGVDNTTALRPPPQAGDVFKVVITENGNDVDFSAFVNGLFDGTVTASNVNSSLSKVTNPDVKGFFAGVMLHGNRQNNIDVFTLINTTSPPSGDVTPPDNITDLSINSSTITSIEIMWTTPGDDGNEGTASSYDIRFSTSPITAANFSSAIAVSNPPDPLPPGNTQKFSIINLSVNTLFFIAIKTLDEVLNISGISNVVSTTTQDALIIVDNFDRAEIGIDWAFSADFFIDNEELACSATKWGSMAVYKKRNNPAEVSIKYGINATQNGISRTAITLLLDSASELANGFMVWRNGSKIDLWSVANGAPLAGISNIDGLLPAPVAGDVFRVVLSEDEVSFRFTCFINGVLDGTVTATKNSQSFAKISLAESFAGIKLSGGSGASNIDDFTMVVATGIPSLIEHVSGDGQVDTVGKTLSDPLVARITDEDGNPVSNAEVNFKVINGGGSLDQPLAPDERIRIEAESGSLVFPMQVFDDPLASDGKFIEVPQDLSNGTATYEFTVSTAGTYVIWGRVIAANGSEDSFRISVDGGTVFIWDTFQGNHQSSWTWDQVADRGSGNGINPESDPVFFDLSSGNHTLLVRKRDERTKLDKILITKDLNYTPSGTENFNGWVSDSNGEVKAIYTLGNVAGINTIHAILDGLQGSPVIFNVTALAVPTGTCTLTPATDQNQIGTDHTTTATVILNGNPVPGIPISFTIFKGPNASGIVIGITDGNGEAEFTYTGNGGVGTDSIKTTGEVNGVPFECLAEKKWVIAQNINDEISVAFQFPFFNLNTNQFQFELKLINSSNMSLFAPLFVEFETIVSSPAGHPITVDNADRGGDGVGAVYDYSDLLGGDGQLDPGEMTSFKVWRFNDPDKVNFFFSANVFSFIPNGTPIAKATGSEPFRFFSDVQNGTLEITRISTNLNEPGPFKIPTEFDLQQNYPNPFNPETTIRYQLPEASDVALTIYNLQGQLVRILVNESKKAGYHQVVWDAKNNTGNGVPSGVYLYRIQAGDFTNVKKLTLLR